MSRAQAPSTDDSGLAGLASKINDLPLLPQVLVKLMQLDPASDHYFDEFETLAKEDPSFAVRVIALANSAASAPAVPIMSLADALARMGTACINTLVAALSVQQVFVPTSPAQTLLWKHAITTAVGAQKIAEMLPRLQVTPCHAYLVGLLHDIGRFVMLEHAPAKLLEVDEANWQTPDDLVGADTEVFKFTHCELGFLACAHWGLPDQVAQIVRAHHMAPPHPIEPGSFEASNFCVQVADRLSVTVIDHAEFDTMDAAERASRVETHCLKTDEDRALLPVDVLCGQIDRISDERKRLLDGLGFR